MILSNAKIVTEDFQLKQLDIEIKGDKFARIGENLDGADRIDMQGKYILPGFIDVHIHGAVGEVVCDENPDIQKVLNFEATQGVTGIAYSLGVSNYDNILKFQELFEVVSKEKSDAILGYVFKWKADRRDARNSTCNSYFAKKVKDRVLAGGDFYENLGVIKK